MAYALDYIDVAQRIADFRAKHPEGALQPADLAKPYTIEEIGGQTYIVVVAAAYRSGEDPRPGIGMAYEVFPGKTNFTRGSELQNAETSAWGRAIVAALAGDTKKGIASAEEVRNRSEEQTSNPPVQTDPAKSLKVFTQLKNDIHAAKTADSLNAVTQQIMSAKAGGKLTENDLAVLKEEWKDRQQEIAVSVVRSMIGGVTTASDYDRMQNVIADAKVGDSAPTLQGELDMKIAELQQT